MIDALGNPQSVLLLGGTSEIGLAIVEGLAGDRPLRVVLAARRSSRLDEAEARLTGRGCAVEVVEFDAADPQSHPEVLQKAWTDAPTAVELAQVNYTAAVSVGVALGERMKEQGYGSIVAFSSVAGERARRSNFVYGSTKAGMDAFYLGLGEALKPSGVVVTVVRPGFVRSRMTEGLTPAPLATTPEAVAQVVVDAVRNRKELVWAPAPMRFVMSGLRHLPRAIFRKLPV